MATAPLIEFLAIARKSDDTILATYEVSKSSGYDYVANVKRVLSSPSWASLSKDKLSLQDGNHWLHVLIDRERRLYIVITSSTYPSRHIYGRSDGTSKGILNELQDNFLKSFDAASHTASAFSLSSRCKPIFRMLAERYNDLKSLDSLYAVRGKLDDVKTVMHSNIDKALANTQQLEELEAKGEELRDSANRFERDANTVRKIMARRACKIYAIVICLILVVLAYIIIPLIA